MAMQKSKLRLFDENAQRYVDALYAVLVMSQRTQYFPEMYEIFGKEQVLKFIDVFSGQTIQVPTRESLEQHIRDVTIWVKMVDDPANLQTIRTEYGLSTADVQSICKDVAEKLSSVGVCIKAPLLGELDD